MSEFKFDSTYSRQQNYFQLFATPKTAKRCDITNFKFTQMKKSELLFLFLDISFARKFVHPLICHHLVYGKTKKCANFFRMLLVCRFSINQFNIL